MNIGILGGTFNPPHRAHLITTEHVRVAAGLDRILFVPSYMSPHKRRGEDANVGDRVAMTRLAIRDNPRFECCAFEADRRSVSFTYETLEYLAGEYPGAKLFVIMGMDNFLGFGSWKHPEKILALAGLIVMNRPGTGTGWPEGIPSDNVTFVTVPELEISSSDIRARVSRGETIAALVPRGVEHYIMTHNLYRKTE